MSMAEWSKRPWVAAFGQAGGDPERSGQAYGVSRYAPKTSRSAGAMRGAGFASERSNLVQVAPHLGCGSSAGAGFEGTEQGAVAVRDTHRLAGAL